MLARVVKDVSTLFSRVSTPHHLHYSFSPMPLSRNASATLYYSFTIMSMNVFARIIPENGPVGMAIPSGAPGASIENSRQWTVDSRQCLPINAFHVLFFFCLSKFPCKPNRFANSKNFSPPFVNCQLNNCQLFKVENIGFEPMTPCLQSRCSSQLS